MLYTAHEMQKNWLAGASYLAQIQADWLNSPANPLSYLGVGSVVASALDVFAHSAMARGKPDFDLGVTTISGKPVAVTEKIEVRKPFGQLKHFVRDGAPNDQPKLLIVAPMSGHYATLLRGTVERMLPGHDVYITDWRDARDVPLKDGHFDLDDYVDYLIEFLEHIGPGAHMLAVCQPSVPCFAAAAVMSAARMLPSIKNSTTMTSRAPSRRFFSTVSMVRSTSSVRS